MTTRFAGLNFGVPDRLAMPSDGTTSLTITGVAVRQVLTQPRVQAESVLVALPEHLNNPIMLTTTDPNAAFHARTSPELQR